MRKNTIWITGAAGKLGSTILALLKKNMGYSIIATDRDVDITDMDAVSRNMEFYRPYIIINCASLSDADYCEDHMVEAFKVNALGARNLAAASRAVNARIIHMSSDDVFCGEHAVAKTEFDFPTPITVYGKSKLAGENYVRELNPRHLIIRSSWVYGGKDDYISYVLDKARKGEKITAALDAVSTPTSTDQLAAFIIKMLDVNEYGIYHAACEGACTRHEYAQTILEFAGYEGDLEKGTCARKSGTVVNTLLENLMMKMTGIYEMPDWKEELKRYMDTHGLKKE